MSQPPHRSPAELASAGPFPDTDGVLDRALALVAYLRAHCAWDARQTARSLVPHLLEETHETVDAIQRGDREGLRGELGDLLLNLAFQLVVAEDEGDFTPEDVVRGLESKMVRRHPHLFGLGEREPWERIKLRERSEATADSRTSGGSASDDDEPGILEGLPDGMTPLHRAHRIQEKVAGVGFDWDDARQAIAKIREELDEVEEALSGGNAEHLEEEVGDLLFSTVNVVRLAGHHAIPALDRANRKFERRFRTLEAIAHREGVSIPDATLQELDRIWDEVKSEERSSDASGAASDEPAPGT